MDKKQPRDEGFFKRISAMYLKVVWKYVIPFLWQNFPINRRYVEI